MRAGAWPRPRRKGRSLARRIGIGAAALALGVILLGAVGVLASSPVPLRLWVDSPRAAFALARGLDPHPVTLRIPADPPLSAVAQLGKQLFYDPSLSASGRMSCASCHTPSHDYGPGGSASVVLGGPDLHTPGFRAVPSLRYLYRQPPFTIGPDIENGNDIPVPLARQAAQAADHARALKSALSPQTAAANLVPQGGLFWDGRADTLEQQINGPLYNPAEMDGGTTAQIAAKLAASPYAGAFRELFGATVFDDPRLTVDEAMFAIARFEIESPSFHPFTSKFDAWLAGKARFTRAELEGYLLFNDPAKGNCAACHLDRPSPDGLPPLFTDFQYEALGVPRNPAIPANADPRYYDLGVCGPYRTDLRAESQYCGMFLTPSLRNVASRHVFFHNGVFHSLRQVLDFYVNRDLHPGRFYPRDAAGKVIKYDDLPPKFRGNVDTVDAPLNRRPGDPPALTAAEIDEVIAFLDTLTDGYSPAPARVTAARIEARRRSD
jgi:cytochrome c peroxidase